MNDLKSVTLNGPLTALRETEIRLLSEIAETLATFGEDSQEDRDRLSDVASDLRDLFYLIVIIGEFNAGKSSFVNALLQDEVLPMGVTPTTEAIELIRHGEQADRKGTVREDGIRIWVHPNTGAPGVAIVDTPGAGSVFAKHEKIAKSFLHRSDLVIFVISAKRAFAETERLYLELTKQYGKKVILVVNQVDLLDAKEQQEVRRFIEQQVSELLDIQPLLFMVSAKESLKAAKGEPASPHAAGMDAVRAHLRGALTEAPPAKQKLLAQLDMAEHMVKRYLSALKGKADLVTEDTTKVQDVQQEMEKQAVGLDAQLVSARADVDRVFEGMRQRGISFIDNNLTLRQIGRLPSREQLQESFQEQVIGRAVHEIDEATTGYINAVVDQSRRYWRGIIDRLNQLRDLIEQEMTGLDSSVYAEQRESLQEAIRIAEGELKSYSTGKVVGDIRKVFETNINGFASSSFAALAGVLVVLLAVATPGPLLGAGAAALAFPAFILAAPVAVWGGYSAWRYYRRLTAETKRDFNERIDQIEKRYHEALNDLTLKERNRLTQYGKQVLTPIFSRLEVLTLRYNSQQGDLQKYLDEIATLRKGIEESN